MKLEINGDQKYKQGHDFAAIRKSHDLTRGFNRPNPLFINEQARTTSALALNAEEIKTALCKLPLNLHNQYAKADSYKRNIEDNKDHYNTINTTYNEVKSSVDFGSHKMDIV